MRIKLIYSWVLILILLSCGRNESFLTVGESHEEVLYRYSSLLESKYTLSRVSKDTIIFNYKQENQPFEGLMLFQNDTCYYQEINMYCSPCYDKAISRILKDKRYRFKPIDEANYSSVTKPHIIMRMKDNTAKKETCSKIRIIDTSKK